MVVGICGYGYSGSGAVLDLLKEYSDCSVANEMEFEVLYCPGGILNLEYNLMKVSNRFHSSDVALSQFKHLIDVSKKKGMPFYTLTNGKFYDISMKYFKQICQCHWKGIASYDLYTCSKSEIFWRFKVFSRFERYLNMFKGYSKREMYFSICPENFYENTRMYIDRLIEAGGYQKERLCVLNQPFPANNTLECFKFFDNPRAIIVDRDPRDLYISIKHFVKNPASFIPMDSVEEFVKYYKILRNDVECNEKILRIHFEDLIYNYENVVAQIESFLNIYAHSEKGKYFNPEISGANTQLFLKYPQYSDDIAYIEKELSEFLYGYTDAMKPLDNSKPFTW